MYSHYHCFCDVSAWFYMGLNAFLPLHPHTHTMAKQRHLLGGDTNLDPKQLCSIFTPWLESSTCGKLTLNRLALEKNAAPYWKHQTPAAVFRLISLSNFPLHDRQQRPSSSPALDERSHPIDAPQQLACAASRAHWPVPALSWKRSSIIKALSGSLNPVSGPLLVLFTILHSVCVQLSHSLWGKSCTSRLASAVTRLVPR